MGLVDRIIIKIKIKIKNNFKIKINGSFYPLLDQNIQEEKDIIGFNFRFETDDRSNAVDVMKKLLQSCWSMCSAQTWGIKELNATFASVYKYTTIMRERSGS
jgi:hypothetical protein